MLQKVTLKRLAGEIFPASEAIELIPSVDLGPPIEVPPIPNDALRQNINEAERAFYLSEILRMKKEKNALILAHNYAPEDVQDAADIIGDSIFLASKGRDSDASLLIESSVLFMNEILAAMKKPGQRVLAPSKKALCSLAAHADPEKIRAWKREHPGGKVISYVNTYIEVKAETDYCCASANASKVIAHVANKYPDAPILFLPDVHLGVYAAKLLEEMGQSTERLWLMMGACHVHDAIRPADIALAKEEYPNSMAIIHPECGCTSACMTELKSNPQKALEVQFRSTQQMIEAARNSPQQTIIMGTEIGNLYPLSKAVPGKKIVPASREAVCAYMKQNTLRNLYECLRYERYEISVDPDLARRARVPIERMLSIA